MFLPVSAFSGTQFEDIADESSETLEDLDDVDWELKRLLFE